MANRGLDVYSGTITLSKFGFGPSPKACFASRPSAEDLLEAESRIGRRGGVPLSDINTVSTGEPGGAARQHTYAPGRAPG